MNEYVVFIIIILLLLGIPLVIQIISSKKKKKIKILNKKIDEILINKKMTDEDLEILLKWCEKNKISEDEFKKIYGDKARIIIQDKLLEIMDDFIYTPKEEKELTELTKNLKIDLSSDVATEMCLSSMKKAYNINKSDKLPIENDCSIILQKNEVCYFQTQCNFFEEKRGVLYFVDLGILYLTNKRIIFEGSEKSKTMTYKSLMNYDINKKGIEIKKTNQTKITLYAPLNYGDVGIFKVIIDKILSNN